MTPIRRFNRTIAVALLAASCFTQSALSAVTIRLDRSAVASATQAAPTFTVNPATDLHAVQVTSPFPGAAGAYTINPWYCATPAAAQRFITYAKAKLNLTVNLSYDWPLGAFGSGSPYQQSGMVPYLDFPSAVDPANAHQNAGGILLEYFIFTNNAADGTLQQWLALP